MDVLPLIGQPEGEKLEYKAVLPPAATLARLISSFANTQGGDIILGAIETHGVVRINGLSDEFRATTITRKAIDLLSPRPPVTYQYVDYQGKRLFVIHVDQSSQTVFVAGKQYVRLDAISVLENDEVSRTIENAHIRGLLLTLRQSRTTCTAAKAQLLDHYQSVLSILDELGSLLYPDASNVATTKPEGKVLMRILFSSCADNFETYMSDLLFEIYLAKPQALKSDAQITVREVLEYSDMQEFISNYAKQKLSKLQRGSVRGFIVENTPIKALGVFDSKLQAGIEEILQIRHLYSHRNGIVDQKFQAYFPSATINVEHQLSLDQFLEKFAYLSEAVDATDKAALHKYQLATFS
jgi:hypothetical protein